MEKYRLVGDQRENWIETEKYKLVGDQTEGDSSASKLIIQFCRNI